MRRRGAFTSFALATVCGVFTAYTTLQPALQEEKEKREGTLADQHQKLEQQEGILSKAIVDDFREAKEEVAKYDKGRFAWGIRNALFGPQKVDAEPPKPVPAPHPEPKDAGK